MSNFDDILEQYEGMDSAVAPKEIKKLKIKEKGDKARISFPLVKKDGNIAQIPVLFFNYSDGEKWARFQAPKDKESKAYKVALQKCGEPEICYVTPIVVYATNRNGDIVSSPVDYELQALPLRGQRLQRLQNLEEVDYKKQDIKVNCDEPNYQNYTFAATPTCVFRSEKFKTKMKNGDIRELEVGISADDVIKEALDMMKEIDTVVANRWTDDKILAFFEVDTSEGSSAKLDSDEADNIEETQSFDIEEAEEEL